MQARANLSTSSNYFYNFRASDEPDSILFKGYEHSFPKHKITGLKRLKYDTTASYSRYIPHYNSYLAQDTIEVPRFYFIGSQERDVIKRLKANKVKMNKIKKDTLMHLGVFKVLNFDSSKKPYEGHFQLSNTKVQRATQWVQLKKGDWEVKSSQDKALFIHSVLQPETEDSYLTWNFFDSYLQQKEYFSSYVFIDKIEEILENDPKLKKEYKKKLKKEKTFKSSEWDQLYFIYKRSPYFEPTYNLLPIYFKNFD